MKRYPLRLPSILLGALALLVFLVAPVRAVTVADADHHFSYSLPSGWTSYSDEDLAGYNKKKVNWIHGGEGPAGGHFLVSADANLSASGPAGLAAYRRDLEAPNCTVESLDWDAKRNAYVAQIGLTTGGQVMHILIFTFPGESERVNFYCYPPQRDLGPVEADYNQLADSFSFGDVPAAAAPRSGGSGHTTWLVIMSVILGGVCFFMFVLIAGTILFAILRKRKGRPS